MKTLLRRLALAPAGRLGPSWAASATDTDPDADPVPHGERLVGLAVVAFLLLALFA